MDRPDRYGGFSRTISSGSDGCNESADRHSTRGMTKLVLLALLLAACGSVNSDGPADVDAAGDADTDPTTLSIISVDPANAATGVAAAATIVIRFDTPMDQPSVEAAWQSADLPPDQLAFAWDAAGTTLTVTPNAPLELAAGAGLDPDVVIARAYAYSIATTAKGLDGRSLDQSRAVSFTTLRKLEVDLVVVDALTRTIRADGNVFAENAVTLSVGDSAGNLQTKTFATFALPILPTGSTVDAATLRADQNSTGGAPYAFGDLAALHTSNSPIDSTAFAATPLAVIGALSVDATPGEKTLAVTDQLVDDLANRATRGDRTQYRLEFATPNNTNGLADDARFARTSFGLTLAYVIP